MVRFLLATAFIFICSLALRAQTILGVDVSHYQSDAPYGSINWGMVHTAGKKFAWSKSTEGTTYTDPAFITNMVNGHGNGVVMGAYHFARPETNSAVSEANYFLSVASPYIGAGYLPPVLDLEDPPSGGALSASFTSSALTTWVQTWMTTVQNATGVAPILYTDGTYANYLNSSLNTYKLWIADPDGSTTATPGPTYLGVWTTWAFKQYSWTSSVSGILNPNVDLNVFHGDSVAFNALISAGITPNFTANITTGCVGMQITFTDHSTSTATITGHRWTFSGGTPSTSTATNPVITYNTAGTYSVKEVVTTTNGADSLVKTAYIKVIPAGTLPLQQTFQSATFPPAGWTMNFQNPGDSAWELCRITGYNSSQCMYFPANCGYVHNIAGQRQQIYTPEYNFTGTTNPKLWFDVAYEPFNRKWSDTLAIYYSLDCGNTWNNIYLKGGMTLCTTGSTDSLGTDTSGGNGCFIPPGISAWRTDTINLSNLTGSTNVMFSFESQSGWGNILYIDNINIASTCTIPATPTVQALPATTNCGSIQLTASSNGCTTCTYTWSNTSTGAAITANTSGSFAVTATNGACNSLPASVSVVINQPPSVTVSPSSQQICSGHTVILTAAGNATSYQWSGAGLQTNSGASVNAEVLTAGTQTYTVTATLNGCTTTANTSVNFTTALVPAISISQLTPSPVCYGSAVSFNSTTINGGTNPLYFWSLNNNLSGTASSITLNSPANGTLLQCMLVSSSACASPDTVFSNILTIQVSPLPVANAGGWVNLISTGSTTIGGNPTASSGTSPYRYFWSPAYGLNADSVANPMVSGINSNSEYSVTVTDANGCTATDSVLVSYINCNLPLPVVQLNLCDLAVQNIASVFYQWYLQGNIIAGATSRFYSASHAGYYFVKVSDTAGCSSQSGDTYVNYPDCLSTGVDALNQLTTFQIYPNPATNDITISGNNYGGNKVNIQILDLIGTCVYQTSMINIIDNYNSILHIGNLPCGAYLIRLSTDDGKFEVKPLVKL